MSGREAATTELVMSDDLVVRSQTGDVEAFATLTAGLTRRLYAVARLILRDDDLASDVVQDSLLRAWVDLRALREPDKFDAWVHRILVRSCYRAARRRRARDVVELQVSFGHETFSPDPLQAIAIRDELDRGFRHLSAELRAVIVLRHYVGLSTVECAGILGIPPGTVQSRLDRAKAEMRAALAANDRTPALIEQVTP